MPVITVETSVLPTIQPRAIRGIEFGNVVRKMTRQRPVPTEPMEIFGIFLSIPAAFVISMPYCLFVAKVVSRSGRLISWLRIVSQIALVLLVAEVILVASIGSVQSRAALGPGFYVVH